MIKLKVLYDDSAELERFFQLFRPVITKTSRPRKSPESLYHRVYVDVQIPANKMVKA